jgi:hypothetical protein
MKEIEIIPIAKNKLKRRGIREDWINDTVRNADQVVEGYGGRKVAQKIYRIGGREYPLRGIFEEKED